MKLLLDENLPVKLKTYFSAEHEIYTVKEQQWTGVKNGELLKLMEQNDFEGLVTIDKNLIHQQNVKSLNIKIFIFNAPDNKLPTLQPFLAELEIMLKDTLVRDIIVIDPGSSV